MKFHVGQPVWAIPYNYRWVPAVVLALPPGHPFTCPKCGMRCVEGRCYLVEVTIEGPFACNLGVFTEEQLRPRDEGQHQPAADSFEWRNPQWGTGESTYTPAIDEQMA